jgi:hypothetical protein
MPAADGGLAALRGGGQQVQAPALEGRVAVGVLASSHAACAPSSPTRDFPGQPTPVITCRSHGRFAPSAAAIASASRPWRASWSAATRRAALRAVRRS